MRADGNLEQELAELDALSRDELSARWQKKYGYLPPTGVRRELLIRSAAWHRQAKRLGGYSTETRRSSACSDMMPFSIFDIMRSDKPAARARFMTLNPCILRHSRTFLPIETSSRFPGKCRKAWASLRLGASVRPLALPHKREGRDPSFSPTLPFKHTVAVPHLWS
jgi:hypothetical protein